MRPAPDYYTDAVFAVTMAEALATGCATVGVDIGAVSEQMTRLEAQLSEDGFDTATPFEQMLDPSAVFDAMGRAFLAKHPIEGQGTEAVCNAASAEIADETLIGSLLLEAPR
ncbi:DUF5333 family protein [Dinoroseobacter sp. PD6]|uniref:DUF5333 family protein n=1 Tax=Dinoroseobacter TaxID=309512 RepID=UPI0002D96EE3|nr:DUF5333 family protein [Dinoroseobacter sp. PD6]MDD9716161.1 DUF5333 family protein [Dinoroseobacter sp. PD6]